MASRATKKQAVIAALLEGFVLMCHQQGASSDPAFVDQFQRVEAAGDRVRDAIHGEPNGLLSQREMDRIKRVLDEFQARSFAKDEFDACHPVAMCIALLSDQLVFVRNPAKRSAIESMLHEAENALTYFDPEWKYSGTEGTEAAILIEELMG